MKDIAVGVEEVKGDVKVIKAEVENRPCDRHEAEIRTLADKVEEVEKEQIRTGGGRAFTVRILAATIPMIPIAIGIWMLFRKTEGDG